jgi:hypothetical protein
MFQNAHRLHPRGATNRGICVDADGAMLGPECILVRRTPHGFRGIDRERALTLQKCLFDSPNGEDWLFKQTERITWSPIEK